MNKISNRFLALILGIALSVPIVAIAQDWYQATGKPVQRSLLNSADLRTEFASIETNIADKLPTLTGNGGSIIAVNSGGTALEALATGVPVASGGTGATTASAARTNLGLGALAILSTVGNAEIDDIAAGKINAGELADARLSSNVPLLNATNSFSAALSAPSLTLTSSPLPVASGGTAAITASAARTSLGLAIGSDVQAHSTVLDAFVGIAATDSNFIVGNGSSFVAESGATARTSLGLGSLATSSTINNGDWSGTDLALTNGGTGASDAGTARTNLGLGSLATASTINNSNWSGTALAVANGGTGSTSTSAAATALGLGTGNSPQLAAVNLGHATDTTLARSSAGNITVEGNLVYRAGGTDVPVTDGGTGSSTAAGARTNLDAVGLTGNETIAGTKTFSTRPVSSSAGGFLSHANSLNTGGSIILTSTVPTDVTGMNAGDIKLVY